MKKHFLLSCLVTIFLINCKKEKNNPEPTPPTPAPTSPLPSVTTNAILSITDSTAVSGGSVISEGASAITAVGICWDTLPSPTTLKFKTNNGAGVGSFVSTMQNLKINKTYYVRAYATNFNGTAYGNEVVFSSPSVATWKLTNLSGLLLNSMLSSGANIYACLYSGLMFSADTGRTWTSKGFSGFNTQKIVQINNSLFVLVSNSGNQIHKSTDNGASWQNINSTIGSTAIVYDIAVLNNNLIAATSSGVLSSNDLGSTWQNMSTSGITGPSTKTIQTLASAGQVLYGVAYSIPSTGSPGLNNNEVLRYDNTSSSWSSLVSYVWSSGSLQGLYPTTGSLYIKRQVYPSFPPGPNQYAQLLKIDNTNNITTLITAQSFGVSTDRNSIFSSDNSNGQLRLSENDGSTWVTLKKIGLPTQSFYSNVSVSEFYVFVKSGNDFYRLKYK